jgi:exonuclease III
MSLFLLNWNVRGINNPAKRQEVKLFVEELNCNFVCFQETKLQLITRAIVCETLGSRFADNYIYLPAIGTRGGILIAGTTDFSIELETLAIGRFSVSGKVTNREDNSSWSITGVYGPQEDHKKIEFMAELRALNQVLQAKWLICGDFNLIKKVNEKSNGNVNLRMMGRFSALIEALELVDFPLLGRRFTWSNNQEIATLTRIDRVLVTKEWDIAFPQFQLTPASSNVSDHCPLQLKPMERNHFCGFRFESHWLKDEDFMGVVQNTWNKEVQSADPTRVLHTKIERTAKALKSWNRSKVRWTVHASNIASEIIFNLDLAQEDRQLTQEERESSGPL